ncbi:MAG: DUF4113 domain-containing protein [Propionibacteriaceae bacterium]
MKRKRPRIALIDVRSMYCACERFIDPRLRQVPLVVLSSNDGCVIARSQEAKDCGIPMGEPWFKAKRNPRYRTIVAKSSNYELYGDMSRRFVMALQELTPQVEQYSIDECFVTLPDNSTLAPEQFKDEIWRRVGLPVSVGIATTKTLAKQAQHWAKLHGSDVLDIANADSSTVLSALRLTDVSDVWGIGRRTTRAVSALRLRTAADLAQADPLMIRRRFGITLERTVRELNGTACIPYGEGSPPHHSLVYSRMLGEPVRTEQLGEVLLDYATHLTRRMRGLDLVAESVTASCSSSAFGTTPLHCSVTSALLPANNDPYLLAQAVQRLSHEAPAQARYNRVGLFVTGLIPTASTTSVVEAAIPTALTQTLGHIDQRFGRRHAGYGNTGLSTAPAWDTRRDLLSPPATSSWQALLEVRA